MEIKVKSYSSQSSLVSSIISFVIGGILLTNSENIKNFISKGIGILLAVVAVVSIVIFVLSLRKEETNNSALFSGIFTLILSIIFLFFSGIIEQVIKFVVGGWILFSGIIRLINTLSMSHKNTKFVPLLIVSILLIAVGIYTIIGDPFNDVLQAVGIIMMIYSVIEIVGYVFYTKDQQEKEEEGATSLLIKEKKEKEDKKKTKGKIKDIEEK